MLINLSELVHVDGKEKDYEVCYENSEVICPGGNYPVKTKPDVFIHAKHTKNSRIKLTVKSSPVLLIPCDRCLDDVEVRIDVDVVLDVDLNASGQDRLEAMDEQPYINGFELDVDCLISGEVILNLPAKVLCSQDCKGICRVCGANRNRSTCQCKEEDGQEPGTLRMSTFQELFNAKNIKEV